MVIPNIILFGITKYKQGGIGMEQSTQADYRQMYLTLFRAATDAVEQIDQQNYGLARAMLVAAQQKAEELFICTDNI